MRLNTDWLEGDLSRHSFPEAYDAIERVVETIPDACEDRFLELQNDHFNSLAWTSMRLRWVVVTFCSIFFVSHLFIGLLLTLGYLSHDVGLFYQGSNAFVLLYSIGLFGFSFVATWRFVRWYDRDEWERQVSSRFRLDQEYLMLEAANRARDELFEEIGRDKG